ncbi:MAG: hypothetical protein QF837_09005 [Acidimicrobiales bacterium]|nr:hypothetical protein [Acidimicrobiales bacterium]
MPGASVPRSRILEWLVPNDGVMGPSSNWRLWSADPKLVTDRTTGPAGTVRVPVMANSVSEISATKVPSSKTGVAFGTGWISPETPIEVEESAGSLSFAQLTTKRAKARATITTLPMNS